MTARFSELVTTTLQDAGWRPGRRIDTRQITAFLESQGITISPAAEEFLSEFHGLKIVTPGQSWANFDVFDAMPWYEPGEIARLESIVASSLCPVGTGNVGNLLISSSGQGIGLDYAWSTITRSRDVPDLFEGLCGVRQYSEIIDLDENRIPCRVRRSED